MAKIKISKVAVIGAGRMGSTIALSIADAGIKVVVVSRTDKDKVINLVEQRLIKQIQNGDRIPADKNRILKNISGTTDIKKAGGSELVIETIIEDIGEKKKLFRQLDRFCSAGTIFVTNTSSLSIIEISKAIKRKDKFLGMHFFYPADKMKLLEIVTTASVSKRTLETVQSFARKIMKETVVVPDIPGFVVNRLIFSLVNEAVNMVEKNMIAAEDIDKAMQLGLNWQMGPLILADVIGLDVCLGILRSLYERTKDKKYKPSPLLVKKVKDGSFGKKTKCGFYKY